MPDPRRLATAPLLSALFATFLTACAGSNPPPRLEVVRLAPPAELLTCKPRPPAPAPAAPVEGIAEYLAALWARGEDCAAKVDALRDWAAGAASSDAAPTLRDAQTGAPARAGAAQTGAPARDARTEAPAAEPTKEKPWSLSRFF